MHRFWISIIATALSATPAAADCVQADLVGTWEAVGVITSTLPRPGECRFVVRGGGEIDRDRSKCSVRNRDNSVVVSLRMLGTMRLRDKKTCTFQGEIRPIRRKGARITAILSADKLLATGNGFTASDIDPNQIGDVISFTAIRQ